MHVTGEGLRGACDRGEWCMSVTEVRGACEGDVTEVRDWEVRVVTVVRLRCM